MLYSNSLGHLKCRGPFLASSLRSPPGIPPNFTTLFSFGETHMNTERLQATLGRWGVLALAAAFATACGDSTGVGDPASVALNFKVSTSAAAPAQGPATVNGPARSSHPQLVLQGTNGILTIDEIRLIVAEVELDGDDDACEDTVDASDDCAEFEAPPRFLNLPLDGSPVEAFVGLIPPNTYDELEFEIEDLEDDEDDTEFAAEIAVLRQEILDEFPDWPRDATGLVVGSFQNNDGDVVSFRVYLEAEIEIERDLVPPLVVGEDGAAPDLTVDIRPDIWFGRSDGSVLELHLWDYDATGDLLEFEVEMEDGFTEIEFDN